MSVATRILFGFLLLLAGGLLLLIIPLFLRVEREYFEATEEEMVDEANIFAAMIEQSLDEASGFNPTSIRNAFAAAKARRFEAKIYNLNKTQISTNLYVTDRRGVVVFDSDGGKAEGKAFGGLRDVAYTLGGHYGARSTLQSDGGPDNYIMFVGAPIRQHGRIVGMLSVSKPQLSLYTFIWDTCYRILWLGLGIFCVIALGAFLITRWYSRPILRLAAYARAVGRGERIAPPRVNSPEVATLARAFEEMRDALAGRKYVEAYVQTMTHEMKSPVAAIRGAAEILRDAPVDRRERFLENIEAEAHRLQQIIDRLLGLSAIESRKALERPEPVSLAELAEAVVDQSQAAAEARLVRVALAAEARPVVKGESFLLEMAMANLIQNAVDFAPPESVVRVTLTNVGDGQEAEFCVEDEGPGIPEYALTRIFERFYSLGRPSTGRKSSGLGLCFVREAVELHGGQVTIENKREGSGVRAAFRLPLNRARNPEKARDARLNPPAAIS